MLDVLDDGILRHDIIGGTLLEKRGLWSHLGSIWEFRNLSLLRWISLITHVQAAFDQLHGTNSKIEEVKEFGEGLPVDRRKIRVVLVYLFQHLRDRIVIIRI